jgi:hypothetical protein
MNTRVSPFELLNSGEQSTGGAERLASRPGWSVDPPSAIFEQDSLARSVWSRVPFYLIGLLLTAMAIAKLWMLLTDSFADIRIGLPKEILWLSVAFEFWLALENFRLRDQRVMAFINTIVFASFAIFASVRLAMGYKSCGCSGSLEIPAWVFIVIDLGIVAWFAGTGRSRRRLLDGSRFLVHQWSECTPDRRGRWAGLLVFALLLVALQQPIINPVRAFLFSESPIKSVLYLDAEDLMVNQLSTGYVELLNRSLQPAKIVGLTKSCRCFDFGEDPISTVIPTNGKVKLPLLIKPTRSGSLQQRVELYLDHPKQFRLKIDVVKNVKGE